MMMALQRKDLSFVKKGFSGLQKYFVFVVFMVIEKKAVKRACRTMNGEKICDCGHNVIAAGHFILFCFASIFLKRFK
jgi:hypothetical protein